MGTFPFFEIRAYTERHPLGWSKRLRNMPIDFRRASSSNVFPPDRTESETEREPKNSPKFASLEIEIESYSLSAAGCRRG